MTTSTTNTSDTSLTGTGSAGLSSSGEQDSAAEQVKHTASVAQDEAKQVAADVRDQARGLLTETRTQVEDQSRTQRDRLVETHPYLQRRSRRHGRAAQRPGFRRRA